MGRKVLFLSQVVPYPPHGGVLQRGFNLLKELGKRHEVHLLAFRHNDILPSEQMEESRAELGTFCESVTYFELLPKRSQLYKLGALGAGIVESVPFSVIAHRSRAFREKVVELVRTGVVDTLHCDTIGLAPYRTYASGLPSVLTHHNIESQLMARRAASDRFPVGAYAAMQANKLKRYESSQAPLFDVNVTVSQEDAKLLENLASGCFVRVVPNGVDVDYFRPGPESENPSIVWAGGMNMFANSDAILHFLREIWPRVKEAVPGVRFDVIGQDPPKELLHAARSDEDLRALGFVDDVRPYVQSASVYVVPIRVGGGTRLKVLDALAMGKPIVSTSIGCEGIAVSNGIDIRIEDGPDKFARAVIELLEDKAQRQYLSMGARGLAEQRYSWSPIADDLSTAYELAHDISGGARG